MDLCLIHGSRCLHLAEMQSASEDMRARTYTGVG
jgi:hypothetical protein